MTLYNHKGTMRVGTKENPITLPEVEIKANRMQKVSKNCFDLVAHFEGCKLEAYLDPIGIPTIGLGATFYQSGAKVKMGDKITMQQAIDLFNWHVQKFTDTVLRKVKRPLKQQELDALVSFAFNSGTSYKTAGGTWKDYDIWNRAQRNIPASEMKPYWESLAITAGGKKLNGLVRRRKSEAHLYINGVVKFFS